VYSLIQYSNQEDNGTYWGGSYFLDSNLLVQRNGDEVLRSESDATGTIGVNFTPGDTVLVQAYAFYTTFPPPATGTATLSLVISQDGEVFYTNTIAYTTGPTQPTTITTSFTITKGSNYSISAFSTYTPVTATPTPTSTSTPTLTPTSTIPQPTNTPTLTSTPTNTPTTPEATYTPTPTVTPTPEPSAFYIKGSGCTIEEIRFFSYTDGPLNDGDVIYISSGPNQGCWTLSTFMPGTGDDGSITGIWEIVDNCLDNLCSI
jgi:hypothetical protein